MLPHLPPCSGGEQQSRARLLHSEVAARLRGAASKLGDAWRDARRAVRSGPEGDAGRPALDGGDRAGEMLAISGQRIEVIGPSLESRQMASNDVLLAGFMDGLASKGGAILDRLQAHAARLLPVHHLASPSPSPSLSPLARSPLPLASLSLPLSPPLHDDSPAPPSPQQWRPPHLRGMPHRRRGGGPPGSTPPARSVDSRGTAPGGAGGGGGGGGGKAEEERVLISEIVIRDKDGGEVEDEELLKVVAGALKVSKANAALTTREVQEDVHRIIDTGYFASCLPTAEDTRDGVRLIFRVEANQEMKGLMCVGANVLPTRVIEDAFRDEYGKVVNIQRLNGVLDVLNGWYSDRGLFGQVTDVELLSDGVVRVKVAEAEVNNITIKFRDRKT
ncbi:unnamed protein product [Closterium sp. NIES-54]